MPAIDRDRRILQSKHAAAQRWHRPDADDIARDLAAARLAEYIKRTVDAAPPLTPEQRDRLALLLRGGDAHGAA
jgi:hypothetical protein